MKTSNKIKVTAKAIAIADIKDSLDLYKGPNKPFTPLYVSNYNIAAVKQLLTIAPLVYSL